MRKPKIIMNVIKEESGYSAIMQNKDLLIGTQGEDFNELKDNVIDAVNLAFEEGNIV